MKSIKPGRGPSMMNGFAGIIVSIFGVGWTIMVSAMEAPIIFPIFGICFVAMGIASTVYSFKNAKSKNRYSSFDIVDSREETDPLNEKYGDGSYKSHAESRESGESNFCPYCGSRIESDHLYCKNCGKRVK